MRGAASQPLPALSYPQATEGAGVAEELLPSSGALRQPGGPSASATVETPPTPRRGLCMPMHGDHRRELLRRPRDGRRRGGPRGRAADRRGDRRRASRARPHRLGRRLGRDRPACRCRVLRPQVAEALRGDGPELRARVAYDVLGAIPPRRCCWRAAPTVRSATPGVAGVRNGYVVARAVPDLDHVGVADFAVVTGEYTSTTTLTAYAATAAPRSGPTDPGTTHARRLRPAHGPEGALTDRRGVAPAARLPPRWRTRRSEV